MNWWIAILSFSTGCLICKPMFSYLFNAVSGNADEFDKGFKKEFPGDSAYYTGLGGRQKMKHFPDEAVEDFAGASFVVLILPVIPASFLAVGFYFLYDWLWSLV